MEDPFNWERGIYEEPGCFVFPVKPQPQVESSSISTGIFNWEKFYGTGKQEEEDRDKDVICFSLTDHDRDVLAAAKYMDLDRGFFAKKKSVGPSDKQYISWDSRDPPPTIQAPHALGGSYESWYNPDVPFFSGSDVPCELVNYCNTALDHYNKTHRKCYKYVLMLKACQTRVSSFFIVDMIFTASLSDDSRVETLEASVRAGFQCHPKVGGYAVVVEQVGKNLDLKCWSVGHVPRECIYKYGAIRCPKRPELLEMCESVLACLSKQGKKYKFLDLLCAYYKKLGPTRYFDVRFKAGESSLDDVADIEIFEAELYFVEKTPNGHWFGGGGRFLGISRGQGSRFVEHI